MTLRPVALIATLTFIIATRPSGALGQADPDLFHATMRGWAEDQWLIIADRTGHLDGRLSERGILHRFNNYIDAENQLDMLTLRFPLPEEYRWWKTDNGFRWTGSSITRRDLGTRGEFRSRFAINDSWDIGAKVDLETNFSFERALVRVNGSRKLSKSSHLTAQLSLDNEKSDGDIEIGYEYGRGTGRHVAVSVAMLDFLNDVIYVNLKAYQQVQIDTTIDYTSQPFAFRLNGEWAFSNRLRVELHGALMTPTSFNAYEADQTDAGFSQDENYGFAAGVVEWAPGEPNRLGLTGTYTAAQTDRRNLTPDAGANEFDLTEVTTSLGAYAMRRLGPWWHIEGIATRQWRLEQRERFNSMLDDVDYLDGGWIGEILIVKRPLTGFQIDVGIAADLRSVERGDGQVPVDGETLDRHNYRGRIDVGWRFTPMLSAWIGAGFDLDGDGSGNAWGGGRGRLTFAW